MKRSKNRKSGTSAGVVDTPLGEDLLNAKPFVEGLARFIEQCQTPMTIAVQGDWGTGKTNTMLLVEHQLAEDVHYRLSDPAAERPVDASTEPIYTIRFNTWQYSQFDMGEKLVGSMLENIGAHLLLANSASTSAKRAEFLKSVAPIASATGIGLLRAGLTAAGGGVLGSVLDEVTRAFHNAHSAEGADAAATLVNVREKFALAVEELVTVEQPRNSDAGTPEKGRVVVFIDDLDRLEPRKAVELMEALKLFLDVPHCVFVLAIDFEVVKRGVMQKYGLTDKREEGKARAFFDKIIQVPFQLPVSAYRVDGFIETLIAQIGIELSGTDERAKFGQLVLASVGSNPRSIKRLINTFSLLRGIAEISKTASGEQSVSDLQLFAVLCLQTAYPDAYAAIVGAEDIEYHDLVQAHIMPGGESSEEDGVSAEVEDRLKDMYEGLGIERGAAKFAALGSAIGDQFARDEAFDTAAFIAAMTQAMTTSSGGSANQSAPGTREKKYGADARRAHMEQIRWRSLDDALAAPEEFVKVLESHSDKIRVGASAAAPQDWVIESNGRRVGMVIVRQKFFHVTCEARWLNESRPGYWFEEFQKQFGDIDQTRVNVHEDRSWFSIAKLRPEESELRGRLAEFWLRFVSSRLDPAT